MNDSKPLGISDTSGFEFSKEMLSNDETYAINFDRIQWDNQAGCYIVVEYLLCEEEQYEKHGATPYTSHPNRYFKQNKMKFVSLWELSQKLGGKLYLVNYAKKGTKFEDEVLLMEVQYVNEAEIPKVKTNDTKLTRSGFSTWFRDLNSRGKR